MSHLQDAPTGSCQRNDLLGGLHVVGQRLLHEDVQAHGHGFAAYRQMGHRGGRNDCAVGQMREGLERRVARYTVLTGQGFAPLCVHVDNADQVRLRIGGNFGGMKGAKVTGAHHEDARLQLSPPPAVPTH